MMILASWPSAMSAFAWFSACSTTPPQYDHENGTTMPTFIAAEYDRRVPGSVGVRDDPHGLGRDRRSP